MVRSRRASLALLMSSVFVVAAFAGCFGGSDPLEGARVDEARLHNAVVEEGLARVSKLGADPIVLPVDVTIHIVLVGIDEDRVDLAAIEADLPRDYSPRVQFGMPRDGLRSGIVHHISYEFHFAPDAFADGLFAHYQTASREAAPTDFLVRYDRMYELGRAGGSMRIVDAESVEDWIEENRDAHGLRFERPSYSLFFLDSWTQHRLWDDTYYWFEFVNDSRVTADVQNMRAWGGTYDFMFLDYAAAPNDSMNDNVGLAKADVCCGVSAPAFAPEGTAWNDPPAWHYGGGSTATIGVAGQKTVTLSERIAHAVDVGVNIRLLGDYAFRPVYKETYHVNVHLWHDGRSIMPTDNLEDLLDGERLFSGLAAQMPWAHVTGSIHTYVAPRDDPGMAAALDRAKAEGAGAAIPLQPVYQYVDAHKEKYRQNDPDVFDVMALLFIFEGHYAFFLPVIVGGVAFTGPDGTAWGTVSSINDFRYVSSGMDMDEMVSSLTTINAHELGHFFGLTHAHDGSRRTADGYESFLDHTWSTTNTVMSYRTRPETTDTFHRDILARAHTLENLELTLRNTESAYRALAAAGIASTPPPILTLLQEASRGFDDATALHTAGAYQEAVVRAIEGRRASEAAMAAAGVRERDVVVESWSASGVHSVGVKTSAVAFRPAVAPTGVQFDYRPIAITQDVERVKVRISWTNEPASWGDFFIGWSTGAHPGLLNMGLVPYGMPVGLEGGVHDNADEGPLDGALEQWFILDIDQFPIFRELGELHMGAGVQGMAVNGAYDVEITVTYRDHGDRVLPDSTAAKAEEEAGSRHSARDAAPEPWAPPLRL